MIEVLVKTLIPVLLLTVVELLFFFIVAVEDVNLTFNNRLKNIVELIFKTDVAKMINKDMLILLEKVNERTLSCSERDRKRYNQSLMFRGAILVFFLLLSIFWLLPKMKINGSIVSWWTATIIESIILLVLLGYFQFTFLNEIIKAPDYVYYTDSELKLGIQENVLKLKSATL